MVGNLQEDSIRNLLHEKMSQSAGYQNGLCVYRRAKDKATEDKVHEDS